MTAERRGGSGYIRRRWACARMCADIPRVHAPLQIYVGLAPLCGGRGPSASGASRRQVQPACSTPQKMSEAPSSINGGIALMEPTRPHTAPTNPREHQPRADVGLRGDVAGCARDRHREAARPGIRPPRGGPWSGLVRLRACTGGRRQSRPQARARRNGRVEATREPRGAFTCAGVSVVVDPRRPAHGVLRFSLRRIEPRSAARRVGGRVDERARSIWARRHRERADPPTATPRP
jgi:hypothetical protein